jgi:hypothetical protein
MTEALRLGCSLAQPMNQHKGSGKQSVTRCKHQESARASMNKRQDKCYDEATAPRHAVRKSAERDSHDYRRSNKDLKLPS